MLLIAIDPGVTTGIAVKIGDKYQTLRTVDTNAIWSLLANSKWDAVIYEDFLTMNRASSAGMHTIHVIGGIKAICELYKLTVYRQAPVKRIKYMTRAKNLGIAHGTHELDALAHLLAWEYRDGTAG